MNFRNFVIFITLFVFITVGLAFAMIMIDPYYFDYQIGSALAGLDKSQAPAQKFTTSVTFKAKEQEPILLVFGARDKEITAQVDVVSPTNVCVYRNILQIPKPPQISIGRSGWCEVFVPSITNGTYTLYITQEEPTYIKVYVFQGPFILRLVMLPIFSLILIFAYFAIKRAKLKRAALSAQQQI